MIKVCHVSCAHPNYDIRIFQKECRSLAKNGYDIHLVISGNNDKKDGVKIHGIGEIPNSRMKRILIQAKKAYVAAVKADADIYHFHDPELLFYAEKMKRKGKKVIFDSHENIIDIFLDKKYIPKPVRVFLNPLYKAFIGKCLSKMDAVITVDTAIKEKIYKYNSKVAVIANYPEIEAMHKEVMYDDTQMEKIGDYICFAGGITPQWNHLIVMKAAYAAGIKYVLCGRGSRKYIEQLKMEKEWSIVDYRGILSHNEVITLLRGALAGVALVNYSRNSNGKRGTLGNTKMFEIMMSGIPIICTQFISWKKIVNTARCGICIEPQSVDALKKSIEYLASHRKEAREMGNRGYQVIKKIYNWSVEEKKLLQVYKELTDLM